MYFLLNAKDIQFNKYAVKNEIGFGREMMRRKRKGRLEFGNHGDISGRSERNLCMQRFKDRVLMSLLVHRNKDKYLMGIEKADMRTAEEVKWFVCMRD